MARASWASMGRGLALARASMGRGLAMAGVAWGGA